MDLNFISFLERELEQNPPARKGARTKAMLKIAAARKLAETGYHELRLKEVTEFAGVSEGTIYFYFKDRGEVIDVVVRCFLDDFLRIHLDANQPSDHSSRPEGYFEEVQAGIRHWFEVCGENRGMMRCLMQMADDEPSFAAIVQNFNERWSAQISLARLVNTRTHDARSPLILTYVMKFMVNELVRKLFIFPDEIFVKKIADMGGDARTVADAASMVWLRTLYPDAPLPKNTTGILGDLVHWIAGDGPLPP